MDTDRHLLDGPQIRNLEAAERWITVLHRWVVEDAERIADLTERVSRLERQSLVGRLRRW